MIASVKYSGAQTSNQIELNLTPFTEISVDANVVRKFISTHKNLVEIKATRVNIKSARHFARSHENTPGVKWFKSDGGYIANYPSNGMNTRIVYDDKGHWFYNVHSYPEAKMDFNIRDLVKSKFYDNYIA